MASLRARPAARLRKAATLPLIVKAVFVTYVALLAGNGSVIVYELATLWSTQSEVEPIRARSEAQTLRATSAEHGRIAAFDDVAYAGVLEAQYVDSLHVHAPLVFASGRQREDGLRWAPPRSVELARPQPMPPALRGRVYPSTESVQFV